MAGKNKNGSSTNRSNGLVPLKGKTQSTKGHKKLRANLTDRKNTKPSIFDSHKVGYYCLVFALAAVSGILNSVHISNMFENERFFSHLSTLERELSFRTEMGLYYSYYKDFVQAPSVIEGVKSIIDCNITEYPNRINVLRRFNLYPELALGMAFRLYEWMADIFKYQTKICYTVNRGQGLAPVESCEGMGDLAFFYVYPVFWLNGLMMSIIFILGFYLSGSIFGGIIASASYFYNHGEATRVMWTPPLRESFSFPFLIAQVLTVIFILKTPKPNWKHGSLLCLITLGFMLPWQFAQFALLTQVCALFGLYVLKYIHRQKLTLILHGLMGAHILNFILQFANTLLMSSFFVSAMIMVLIIVKLEPFLERISLRILIWATQGLLFISGTVSIKICIAKLLQIKDDAHIVDILKSKFTDFKDFHTLLYVCAPEFDFLGFEAPTKMTKTLLIPCALVSATAIIIKVLVQEWNFWLHSDVNKESEEADSEDNEYPTKLYTEHFYMLLQTTAFVLMAIIIMRLKLFATPALCMMASLIASRDLFGIIRNKYYHQALVVLIFGMMSVQGYDNLKSQFETKGEYNNPDMEQLVEWVEKNSPKDAIFAGAMPTMATIKLTTKRAVVNHPHYEDAGLRERTKNVYQLYSRKPCLEVYNTIKSMQVTHLILEDSWCTRRFKPGCALPEVWDVEDPKNKDNPACCSVLLDNPSPFKIMFQNNVYAVLGL